MSSVPDDSSHDEPTGAPVDAEEERERLRADAKARGLDEDAAVALARKLARMEPEAEAYRAVDRRLAMGCTIEEAEEILLSG